MNFQEEYREELELKKLCVQRARDLFLMYKDQLAGEEKAVVDEPSPKEDWCFKIDLACPPGGKMIRQSICIPRSHYLNSENDYTIETMTYSSDLTLLDTIGCCAEDPIDRFKNGEQLVTYVNRLRKAIKEYDASKAKPYVSYWDRIKKDEEDEEQEEQEENE